MEHFDHPSYPHFNYAIMAGFGLRAPSSLLVGKGLIVFFILSKIVGQLASTSVEDRTV